MSTRRWAVRGAIILALTFVAATAVGGRARADSTPCGFDIFVLSDGEAQDITNTPFACEFNPDWSLAAKQVVYDQIESGSQQLNVTDLRSGTTTPVVGAPSGANNGSFSPNGQSLAFDRFFVGDPTIYVLPSDGGNPHAVVADASDADWSPNSRRLVFSRPSDGSVRSVDLAGGSETIVAPAGAQGCQSFQCGVAWSPDGRFVAFSDGFDIWAVRVAPDANPLGPPFLVSAGGAFVESQPAWTANSQSILFTSNLGADGTDSLWRVPLTGGAPERIETPSQFSFDPAVARGGAAVAYSGSTP
jgi:Tol biopolymer transport system component